jgi:hypothetical protein
VEHLVEDHGLELVPRLEGLEVVGVEAHQAGGRKQVSLPQQAGAGLPEDPAGPVDGRQLDEDEQVVHRDRLREGPAADDVARLHQHVRQVAADHLLDARRRPLEGEGERAEGRGRTELALAEKLAAR